MERQFTPKTIAEPQGLQYINDFLTKSEEQELIDILYQQKWCGRGIHPNAEMKRRLQFYGYVFSYRYRIVTSTAPNAPQPLKDVVSSVEQVADDGDLMKRYPFNMVLINEYELGQGIMAHNDAPLIFGPIIAIVSLLSPCIISFFRGDERRDIVLEPRSLLIMQDEARYEWTHEISKNHIDIVRHPCTQEDGQLQSQMEQTVQRSTRVSITLRHVLQTHLNDVFT